MGSGACCRRQRGSSVSSAAWVSASISVARSCPGRGSSAIRRMAIQIQVLSVILALAGKAMLDGTLERQTAGEKAEQD